MNPAASSEDQLIAQTHRLSLDEPRLSISAEAEETGGRTRGIHGLRDGGVRTDMDVRGRSGDGEDDGVAADGAAGARPRGADGRAATGGTDGPDGELLNMDLDLDLEEHEEAYEEECKEEFYSRPCLSGEGMRVEDLPTEILFHIFEFLDVSDLLTTSRTCHTLRSVSLTPLLHIYRLRRTRELLPPLLWSPTRPSLADLISKSIFLTNTSVVSRRLGRSLVSIRLARRLAARPSAEALVERAVLPKECVPGMAPVVVAPAIIQRRKVIERERIKDGLRRWIEGKWRGEVREREECQRRWEESRGVGRVWRLRKFWERVGRGDIAVR